MDQGQNNNNKKVILIIVAIIILSALAVYLYTQNSQTVPREAQTINVDYSLALQGSAPPITDEDAANVRSELAKPPATTITEAEKEKIRAELSK